MNGVPSPSGLSTKQGLPLTLRRPRASDAQDVWAYIQAPEVFGSLLQLPHPTLESWEERLKNPPEGSFSLTAELALGQGRKVVALAGLFQDRGGLRRRHVLHMGMSIAVEFHGQGIGDALMRELLSYADNWAQCLRVELEVFDDNTRAIGLYQKHGFVIEGTKRCDAFRDGRYVSSHLMGRLRPDAEAMMKAFNPKTP